MAFNPKMATKVRLQTLKMYKDTLTDPQKQKRIDKQMCVVCFYRSGIVVGRGFTQSNCKICGAEMCFTNTDVDSLCPACARDYGLCKHCGAKIDYHLETD